MAPTSRSRLLVTETMDPDGAMYRWISPDLEALGWEVLRFPVEEALHNLGARETQRLLVELAESYRPHVLLVHPPYDFLSGPAGEAIRRLGTRICGFAFDDTIYVPSWRRAGVWDEILAEQAQMFDVYMTTDSSLAAEAARRGFDHVHRLRFAASPAPFERPAELPRELAERISRAAVLVGRAYPRRIELLHALAGSPFEVHVFGSGWQSEAVKASLPDAVRVHGFLSREEMVAVYRRAGVVITTGDWERDAVAMVKFRLLEVAMCGGFQIAQASPDLRGYFSESEVPAYSTAEELRERIAAYLPLDEQRRGMADRARRRALSEHRWLQRWPELVALLDAVGRPLGDLAEPASLAGFERVLVGLGLQAEREGRLRAAQELFAAVLGREPEHPAAAAGLGRCAYRLGEAERAAAALERAVESASPTLSRATRHLYVRVPNPNRASGLGVAGYLNPTPENLAFLLAALLDAGQLDEAIDTLDSIEDPDLLVTIASLLEVDDDPDRQPFWSLLLERALSAQPIQQAHLQTEQAAGWTAALERLKGWAGEGPEEPRPG